MKLDSYGSILWFRNYGLGECYSIIQTSDSGFVACGQTVSSTFQGYVVKIDKNGLLRWQRNYVAGYEIKFNSIIEANDSGYIIAGYVSENYTDPPIMLIKKIDTNGTVQWEKRYSIINSGSIAKGIVRTSNGYLIGGSIENNQNVFYRSCLLKIAPNGDSIFSKVFTSDKRESLLDIKEINSNRYVISMFRDSVSNPALNSKVIITDSVGNVLYQKVFLGVDYLSLNRIQPVSNGDIVFAGTYKYTTIPPGYDFLAIRTDSILDAPLFGIVNNQNSLVDDFALYQNFPNPFNSTTKIKFRVSRQMKDDVAPARIIFYNALGEEILSKSIEHYPPGTYEYQFVASDLASGVYFCVLCSNGFLETRKMILIK